jgi:hypothetical protein
VTKSLGTISLLVTGFVLGAALTWLAARWPTADLEHRIETAEGSQEHAVVAPLLLIKAREYDVAAAFHRRLAEKYARAGQPASAQEGAARPYRDMAAHCLNIAAALDGAASETRALAQRHQQLDEAPPTGGR